MNYPPATPTTHGPSRHIMQVPVISTFHITKEDGQRLALDDWRDSLAACHGDGHILHFEADSLDDFSEFSEPFQDMISEFADLGYTYLRLDIDGEILPDLPTFEW